MHKSAIRRIALGEESVFEDSSDEDILILQKWIAQYIAAHGIHTHLVEAFVREASLCAATNRDETLRSFFAICRSANHYDLNIDISESEKDRVRKGNSFRTKGVHGSRQNRKSGDTETSHNDRNRVRGSIRVPYVVRAVKDLHECI